jgi:glycosyltransferase involved in cell wall biosynthesis
MTISHERAPPVQTEPRRAGDRGQSDKREFLMDVSRLIWRVWRGGHPTGIDRVCIAYLDRFGGRAQAVVQQKGRFYVLSPSASDRLFELLRGGGSGFRSALIRFALGAWFRSSGQAPDKGMVYFNIGHTGLDDPSLPSWLNENGLRAVYLIHDLIPISHPQFCRPGEPEKHARRMMNVLSSARAVIGNSQATLDEMADFAESRGLVMPASVAAWISGSTKPEVIAAPTIREPYFVTLGTIEARKNHLLLLKVWRGLINELGSDAPKLVIIGQRGWEADETFEMLDRTPAFRSHVLELNSCNDSDAASLVSGARALLMPSFAEGFGLPVIEALQLGTPVIASNLRVYHEIASDLPTYLDPRDEAAWARTIKSFVGDSGDRERQRNAMKNYKAPDWPQHFAIVEQFVQTL